MEITRAGMARPDGSPKDIDREVFTLFSVMNENLSPYIRANVKRFAEKPYPKNLDDDEFVESNLMHSINGYVFGNQPMITLHKGCSRATRSSSRERARRGGASRPSTGGGATRRPQVRSPRWTLHSKIGRA